MARKKERVIQIKQKTVNKVNDFRGGHRGCPYFTKAGRCKLNRGKACSKKNCKLLKHKGCFKIEVYPFQMQTTTTPVILRRDVLHWFDVFIIDYEQQTELIINKKDWSKLNRLSGEKKILAILDLFKKRFECKLKWL